MRYIVTGVKGDDRRPVPSQGEAAALDVIDDFVAAGYRVERVEDESGVIDPMLLVERLQARGEL